MKNISPQELTIGNYIITNDAIFMVVDIMCDSVNTTDHHELLYEMISGIPLTEQWLIDFGFEKTDEDYYFQQSIWVDKHGFRIAVSDIDFTFKTPHCNSGFYTNLQFVHELQILYQSFTR